MQKKGFSINKNKNDIKCIIFFNDLSLIKKVVLCMHGFGSCKDTGSINKFAEYVISKNKDVAIISYDLPAHGEDVKKRLYLKDCMEYLDIVISYIKEKYTNDIYAYGTSFSGYQLMYYLNLKQGNPFKNIALRCPAINMHDVFLKSIINNSQDLMDINKGKDVEKGYNRKFYVNKEFIEELKNADIIDKNFIEYAESILIIQAEKDTTVSPIKINEFADRNIIERIIVPHCEHSDWPNNCMTFAIKEISKFFGFKN